MANNLDNLDRAFKYYDTIMSNTFKGMFALIRSNKLYPKSKHTHRIEWDIDSRKLYNHNHAMAIVIHDRVLNDEVITGIRRNTRV